MLKRQPSVTRMNTQVNERWADIFLFMELSGKLTAMARSPITGLLLTLLIGLCLLNWLTSFMKNQINNTMLQMYLMSGISYTALYTNVFVNHFPD